MKLLKELILCSCLFIALSSIAQKQDTISKEDLVSAIKKFNDAFRSGDVNTLASMITDTYQHTNGSNPAIGKTAWLNYLNKRKTDIESGKIKVISYEMDQTQIQIYNTSALVTARISVSSIINNNKQQGQYRVTNLWIYEQGKWKRAGFHDGKIK